VNTVSFLNALAPRRIAVFRALQLGDMLCAVPALRALRRAAPLAHITLIGLPWAHAFVARYAELIDELVVFPGAKGFPEQDECEHGLPAFFAEMRARRFDLAIQLHGSGGPANDLLLQLGARAHAGFVQPDEPAREGRFIRWPDALPEPLRYTALTAALGAPAEDAALAFPLEPEDWSEYAHLEASEGIEADRLVVIHPGAQLPSRRWPAERFAAVADHLAADGWQIAITGTAAEAALTGAALGAMEAPALHLAGSTSLGSLAALVSRAQLVVCNDTGVSHIAAAVRTPSVVVASGSDTRRWAPLDRALHRVLADYPPCRPCMFRDCPYGHPCALNVQVDQVVRTARAQLARWHLSEAGERVAKPRLTYPRPASPFTLHTRRTVALADAAASEEDADHAG
jgi:ADP-heptose:LPS heptosyltransferase